MPSAEQKETLQVGGWKISILFLGWLSCWSKGGSVVGARITKKGPLVRVTYMVKVSLCARGVANSLKFQV